MRLETQEQGAKAQAETQSGGSAKESLLEHIYSQFNEERLFKDLSSVQLDRILVLDELAKQIPASEEKDKLIEALQSHLEERPHSLASRYLLGLLSLQEHKEQNSKEKLRHSLNEVLEAFIAISKWPIVDHIADLLLSFYKDHRIALRAKVESVANLRGKKESRPYLERLAKIDRNNPEISKRYALLTIDEDKENALIYLKQAAETSARLRDYKKLTDIWLLMIQHDHKDLAFFERIERIVVGDRQKIWIATHLSYLVAPYRAEEHWDTVILLLKKILHYEPHSPRARSDLVRAYRAKYAQHSLLAEFLKISDLTNHKRAVEPCIASFERNIVFDLGNYVMHRSRGVGKITQIDNQQVSLDFAGNPDQKMSIQMAIHSLQPLQTGHIWARHYENKEEVEELFQTDTTLFLEALLSSFGKRMYVKSIRGAVTGRLLKAEEWTKWWASARAQIKKDPRFGFNPHKKDELILRDNPMSLTEELSGRFQSEADWNKKLELAFSTLKSRDTEGAALLAVQFYKKNEKSRDALKRIHSYLFLQHAKKILEEEISSSNTQEDIEALIAESSVEQLQKWSLHTHNVELKRDLIHLVLAKRPDYTEILWAFLLEVPVRAHRFIFSELERRGHEKLLQDYLDYVCRKYRDHPELVLWMARSILYKQWEEYSWVQLSQEDVFLLVFRLLKPLVTIETKGTRLKNMALACICGTSNITVESLKKYEILTKIVKEAQADMLQRLYALFCDVPYIPDAHKENLYTLFKEVRPDLEIRSAEEEEEGSEEDDTLLFPPRGLILSSTEALHKRRDYLDRLIHVDMVANSKEIGEAQEKGDLRENAEYKAAMERQSQLQAEITTVSKELQKARAIQPRDVRTDLVSIGTKVKVLHSARQKEEEFTILGPWDANTEENIISYESPLAKVLVGRKIGEEAALDQESLYVIREIHSALLS